MAQYNNEKDVDYNTHSKRDRKVKRRFQGVILEQVISCTELDGCKLNIHHIHVKYS